MPLIGTFGAGSAQGFGQRRGAAFPFNAEYLVIGGGGAGGLQAGGGAGAGGYRTNNGQTSGGNNPSEPALELLTGEEYQITIGSGGVSYGPAPTYPITVPPTPGTSSVFATITSLPGGHGGGYAGPIVDSGNALGTVGSSAAKGGTPGSPIPFYDVTGDQGHRGGNHGSHTGPGFAGGGGGGAGGTGGQGGASGGPGGPGLSSDITGSSVTRTGGGGGGGRLGSTVGTGGPGGGGPGTTSSPSNAPPGTVNTGSGGGDEGYSAASHGQGGNGGSGFVAIRVPDGITATFSPGVTSSLSTAVPGYNIYSVTATSTGSETVVFEKA